MPTVESERKEEEGNESKMEVGNELAVQSSCSTEVGVIEGPQQVGEDGTTQLPLQMTLDLENHQNRTQIENFQREMCSTLSPRL
jgi:hypothetical protein